MELDNETNQYLTFTLGEESFAIEITKVREVLDYSTVTKVPRMPSWLRGVINLRGSVVPVIDLRLILEMSAIQKTVETCIVIVDVQIENESVLVGALTDSVQEVLDIDPAQIGPPPRFGTRFNTEFIRGMGKKGEDFLIILDIDKVLDTSEIHVVQGVATEAAPEYTELQKAV